MDTCAPALARQQKEAFPIILYQREVEDRDWRGSLRFLQAIAAPVRDSPVRQFGQKSLGRARTVWRLGYILRTPVDRDAVMRAVKSGWSLWRNQQKLRLAAKARH